jgi:hypothetical protein
MPIAPPAAADAPDPPVITMWPTNCTKECLAIGDYVCLEPVWVGRIFASREIPRATYIAEMFVKGERRSIFTKSSPGKLRVREDDLYLKASELDRFLKTSNKHFTEPETNLVKKNNELSAVLKRIKEDPDAPVPLTKQQMLAIRWPIRVNLEKILSDPPNWAEEARVFRNPPGSGSSLWNPAVFAYCLATTSSGKRPKVRKEVLDSLIRKHFKAWIPAWEDLEHFIESP